jgi:hypothetical protein
MPGLATLHRLVDTVEGQQRLPEPAAQMPVMDPLSLARGAAGRAFREGGTI